LVLAASNGFASTRGELGEEIAIADQLLKNTSYDYDLAGRLVKQTDPLGRFNTHTYDVAGRRTSMVDGVANAAANPLLGTTSFTYDRLGQVTGRTYSDGTPAVTYTYDPAGRVASMVDGKARRRMGMIRRIVSRR
jgi:YD repeat-containing protein